MAVEILINGSTDPKVRYLSWTPVLCSVRQVDGTEALKVQVRTEFGSQARLQFYRTLDDTPMTRLQATLPANGEAVEFYVSGRFGSPSLEDNDTGLIVRSRGRTLALTKVMVRVRKDANELTDKERDLFVSALSQFNDQGRGGFSAFREMHVRESTPEAHGGPWFLPWHRAYLLDLERELQAIIPSVSLPYWQFDLPAPKLFHQDFLGISVQSRVVFGQSNPLNFWTTDGIQGINRQPRFNTSTQAANAISEESTLALGGRNGLYRFYRRMEGSPHGPAHTSFFGSISRIPTAAKDPLFFLLHCNVDRLWAKWQWLFERFDKDVSDSYDPPLDPQRPGHSLDDSMWPWNKVTTRPRPNFAPRDGLAESIMQEAPGAAPKVSDMIDLQGKFSEGVGLGYDYDDVPY